MAAEMPERIWAVRGGGATGSWYLSNGFERIDTQYIRADLCVLASTHQRVIEALREAEKALEACQAAFRHVNAYQMAEGSASQITTAEDMIRAALATIKETAP